MEIKSRLIENKKVVFKGKGIESLKKIDEMLK